MMNDLNVQTLQLNQLRFVTALDQRPAPSYNRFTTQQVKQALACEDDRQFETFLAQFCRPPQIDVRLDFENLYIGLRKARRITGPDVLIEAVKTAVRDFGEINKITAYADWSSLVRKNQENIQRQLELEGIETRYQVNIRSKNSADMKIATDIHELLEKDSYLPGTVDIFVLGTGDRDFRPVVKSAQERGKKVIVLSLRKSLSRLLGEAASEVRYLDHYLSLPKSCAHRRRQLSVEESLDRSG